MAGKKYDGDVKNYTPDQLEKLKASARKYYQDKKGEVSVKVLSRVGKVPQGYIRQWMKEEDWDSFMEDKGDLVILTDETKEVLKSGAEEYGLSEKEELFCYHYLKTFNHTTSAIRAGYSSSYAHNKAYLLLKDDKIKRFLSHVKSQRNEELFIDGMRVIQEYVRIAFADMTDFVVFGPSGVSVKPSNQVDGQIITQVKEGRDGITIQLADKMRALEKLEKYLGLDKDDIKTQLEQRKLDLQEAKLQLLRDNLGNNEGRISVTIVDDI